MRELAERAWFLLCLALGRLLRSSRYAKTAIVYEDGEPRVRKRRTVFAPLLVRMGDPLLAVLDAGVRVLPQRAWEEREQLLHQRLRGTSVRIEADGTLVLPYLTGRTLAAVLEDPTLEKPARKRAIELAVVALAELHARGFTHGDAMAENVMVDRETGVAHWFDFETVHDPRRPMPWRRADDVRALLATCLLRTDSEELSATLGLILDAYADDRVARLLAASFASPFQRPLLFQLGQAGLSFRQFGEIGRLLRERIRD